MLCINNPYTDVAFNLAAEEYLLKQVRDDIFMVWQNEPSVILGKHQDKAMEVDLAYAEEHQIGIFKRQSGGGAVYHDLGNVNLTFIETSQQPNFDKYVGWMRQFLSGLGVDVQADNRRGLYLNGLKVSGSAQYMFKDRVMFHATLLFSTDLDRIKALLLDKNSPKVDNVKPWVRSVKSPVTNLAPHIKQQLDVDDIKHQLINFMAWMDHANYMYTFTEKDRRKIMEIQVSQQDKSERMPSFC
ncbi:MAG: Lipoate-protein ligase LplJ [Bacteroidetes bacterium ADurb.Bin416]|nr:MAG: Lipoate-protein ligase LplJ [Bacteroidetes bacterium ADurb.Bin416]